MGSLRIYHALAQAFDGQLSAAAIAQGLEWFAEHVAEARAHPGSHPNIELLLAQRAAPQGWRLVPLPALRKSGKPPWSSEPRVNTLNWMSR